MFLMKEIVTRPQSLPAFLSTSRSWTRAAPASTSRSTFTMPTPFAYQTVHSTNVPASPTDPLTLIALYVPAGTVTLSSSPAVDSTVTSSFAQRTVTFAVFALRSRGKTQRSLAAVVLLTETPPASARTQTFALNVLPEPPSHSRIVNSASPSFSRPFATQVTFSLIWTCSEPTGPVASSCRYVQVVPSFVGKKRSLSSVLLLSSGLPFVNF